jgi:uncharacterized protein
MKLHLSNAAGKNIFTGYGSTYVLINHRRYERSLIVGPDFIEDWLPHNFEDLEAAHFESLLKLEPEVVLLGTGKQTRIPPASIMRPLIGKQIGLEVMGTFAACRTYNVLVSDERRVVAALLLPFPIQTAVNRF